MISIIYNVATLTGEILFIVLYICTFFGLKQPKEFLGKHPLLMNTVMVLVLIGMIRFVFSLPMIIHS